MDLERDGRGGEVGRERGRVGREGRGGEVVTGGEGGREAEEQEKKCEQIFNH